MTIGFNPTVFCPHCGNAIHPEFTGYGRTGLNTRSRECLRCGNKFYVTAYVFTTKEDIEDIDIRGVKDRIKLLRNERRRQLQDLQSKQESIVRSLKGENN